MTRSKSPARNVAIIINRSGGTMKSMDLNLLGEQLTDAFQTNGYAPELHICTGKKMVATLEKAAKNPKTDVLVACGGDGTVSAAAGIAWKYGKTLGVLPGGTMNLFVRALGGPLDLAEATRHLAEGNSGKGDIATANGRSFIHQFSVGLHPRIVAARRRFEYRSRIGKMLAGLRATLQSLSAPPAFEGSIRTSSEERSGRFSLISVSNNLFGEGHMPYPGRIDGGVLGLYTAPPLTSGEATRLAGDLMIGNLTENPDLSITGDEGPVELRFPKRKRSDYATIDGELVPLETKVEINLHRDELKLLIPKPAEPDTLTNLGEIWSR